MDTVKAFAKEYGYEYKLWTESHIDKLDWDAFPGLREGYATRGLPGRADILRYLILFKEGGLYIDADTVLMKPAKFHSFLEKNPYSVFFGWEQLKDPVEIPDTLTLKSFITDKLVANGLIAVTPSHPFMKSLLEFLPFTIAQAPCLPDFKLVGPFYVTRIYTLKKTPDIHVYPTKYFYPIHWHGIKDPLLHTKMKIPGESMLFQYGYSTNGFSKYFNRSSKGNQRKD